MTGAPIEDLEDLLRALSHERSLGGRLRVLGQSWALLRSLSPGQREQVALRIASKWAWKRVEKAFLSDGELSENERLVGRVFERMGGSDPKELRNLAKMIKQGDRAGTQDLLMMTLSDVLEETADEEEQERAETAEPPEVVTVAPVPEEPLRVAAPEPGVEALPESMREPNATPAVAPPPPAPASVVRERAPVPAAAVPAPAVPEPEPELGIASELETSGVDRLRALRSLERNPDPGGDLGRRGRAELLESLGGGWATRRALSRMIRKRSLDDLDEALELVGTLARPGQQTWCLGDLLQHWELRPGEAERVVARAPTDAAHRRLRGRAEADRL